jgi:hypothetical protein
LPNKNWIIQRISQSLIIQTTKNNFSA